MSGGINKLVRIVIYAGVRVLIDFADLWDPSFTLEDCFEAMKTEHHIECGKIELVEYSATDKQSDWHTISRMVGIGIAVDRMKLVSLKFRTAVGSPIRPQPSPMDATPAPSSRSLFESVMSAASVRALPLAKTPPAEKNGIVKHLLAMRCL